MEAAVAAATTSSLSLLLVSSTGRRSLASLPPSPSLHHRPPPCNNSRSICSTKQYQASCLAIAARPNSRRSNSRSSSLRCSSSATGGSSSAASASSEIRWVLDPAGDGDWRHIGYKVERSGALEIASDAVTVGRVADKADIVIPIATVSGTHARLEKKEGRLLVTDLGSTNGTYINERRLNPGFPIPIDPGSFLIFGDIHLAMFRVRKTIVEVPKQTEEPQTQVVSAAVEDATS